MAAMTTYKAKLPRPGRATRTKGWDAQTLPTAIALRKQRPPLSLGLKCQYMKPNALQSSRVEG